MTKNVIIIGGGPAGYTAALYAARAGLEPLLIEGPQPGGQLMITSEVENYPGFRSGIMGPDLMEEMREQARRFGATFVNTAVGDVDFSREMGPNLYLYADNGSIYHAKTVIIATGASAKWLGIPGEKELWGRGVSACATCDGFFFRGKKVIVIGGGDSACEEALFLANLCQEVYIVHRRAEFRASAIMQERVKKHLKIKLYMDCVPTEFSPGSYYADGTLGYDVFRGLRYLQKETGWNRQIIADGAFVAIGHEPSTKFLDDQVALDENGYIIHAMPGSTGVAMDNDVNYDVPIPGVFAAGDCTDHKYRQAITAAGEGCKAAIDAERYLRGLD